MILLSILVDIFKISFYIIYKIKKYCKCSAHIQFDIVLLSLEIFSCRQNGSYDTVQTYRQHFLDHLMRNQY